MWYCIIWPCGFFCFFFLSRRHVASFPHRRYSFPLLHLSLNPSFQSALDFFLFGLFQARAKMLPFLSFWKIKQVLALQPALNRHVDDLSEPETDSGLRSVLSCLS